MSLLQHQHLDLAFRFVNISLGHNYIEEVLYSILDCLLHRTSSLNLTTHALVCIFESFHLPVFPASVLTGLSVANCPLGLVMSVLLKSPVDGTSVCGMNSSRSDSRVVSKTLSPLNSS